MHWALGGELGHNSGGPVQAKIRPSSCNQWCMRRSGTGFQPPLRSTAAKCGNDRHHQLLSILPSQLAPVSVLFTLEKKVLCCFYMLYVGPAIFWEILMRFLEMKPAMCCVTYLKWIITHLNPFYGQNLSSIVCIQRDFPEGIAANN